MGHLNERISANKYTISVSGILLTYRSIEDNISEKCIYIYYCCLAGGLYYELVGKQKV